jgi:hypothetical protein
LGHSLRNIRFRKHIYDWLAFAADDRPDFFSTAEPEKRLPDPLPETNGFSRA